MFLVPILNNWENIFPNAISSSSTGASFLNNMMRVIIIMNIAITRQNNWGDKICLSTPKTSLQNLSLYSFWNKLNPMKIPIYYPIDWQAEAFNYLVKNYGQLNYTLWKGW